MAAKRKSSTPRPVEQSATERAPGEGEEAAWARSPPEVVYDRVRDRERALGANRRWMMEEEEEEEEDEDDEEGPEGYHCQICGYHTDQLQPFNIHLHTAHPTVVLQELYGLLGLTGGPIPGLTGGPIPGLTGGPIPGLTGGPIPGLTGGPIPGLTGGPIPGLTGGPIPGLTGGPIPGLTGGPIPGLTGGPIPGLTGGPIPGLTGGPIPGMTGGPIPRLTGGPIPGLTGGPIPGLTGGPIPGLTGGPISGLTGGPIPGLTGGPIPGLTGGPIPGLTGGPIPGLTGGPIPRLTGGPIPRLTGGPSLGLTASPVPSLGLTRGPVPGLTGGPVPSQGEGEGGKPDIVQIDLTLEDEAGERTPGREEEEEEEEIRPRPGSVPETGLPAPISSSPSLEQPGPPTDPTTAPQEPGPELDSAGPLAEAFSHFPYPTPAELARCGLSAGLPAERVRLWFMVQRLRHGISWTPEEVREARDKLWHKPGTLRLAVPPTPALLADSRRPLLLIPPPNPNEPQASPGACGEARERAPSLPEKARTSLEAWGCLPGAPPLPGERRWRKTKGQLAALKSSFARDRYPGEPETRRLQARTGLGKSEIKRWFSDSRYQLRNLPASCFQLRLSGGRAWQQRNGGGEPKARPEAGPGREGGGGETGGDALHRETAAAQSQVVEEEEEVEVEEVHLNQRKAEEASGLPGSSVAMETSALRVTGGSVATETPACRAQAPGPSPGGRPRKTKEQLAILKTSFLRSQWPSGDDYTRLVERTALARADIIQWFGDTRYALKNGQLKWVHRGPTAFAAGPGPRGACGPLEEYLSQRGRLRQEDLYRLCVETRMSAQQVAEWFRRRAQPLELELEAESEEDGPEEEEEEEEEGGGGGPSDRKPDHGSHIVRVML
ncbi:zinc fingers and homeoboxes protein 1-like [Heptranchias perlo]|uniref:zinc fingers and homeoboxes protein 1-like n=1 Tax=Heptranchias perlo TaxID=212740 RepID=UPI003559F8FC